MRYDKQFRLWNLEEQSSDPFTVFFRRLLEEDTRLPAFLSMQKIADVVGPKVFVSYISKLTAEQKKIYDDLSESRARVEDRLGSDIFLKQINMMAPQGAP